MPETTSQGNPRRATSSPTASPQHSQDHSADAPQRRPLEAARQHVQQHPHGRDILQDNRRRNARFLDGEIVEVVGGCQSENPSRKNCSRWLLLRTRRDDLPFSSTIGRSISNAIVVRLWARMRGSIGRRAWPPAKSLPVKTARPKVAENPQKNVAAAMKR